MRLIGLDVGDKRIGVARVDTNVKIALPYGTVLVNGFELEELAKIATNYNCDYFVLGLPRNSSGEETAQSLKVREFAKRLKQHLKHIKIRFQDESLTSVEAENRLKSRGRPYQKGDIDAESATIILQDLVDQFIGQNVEYIAESPLDSLTQPKPKPSSKSVKTSPTQLKPKPKSVKTSTTDPITQFIEDQKDQASFLDLEPDLSEDIFSDINADAHQKADQAMSASAISAKIAAITKKIPSASSLILVIKQKQYPAKISASLRRLPKLISTKNFAEKFHRPTQTPSTKSPDIKHPSVDAKRLARVKKDDPKTAKFYLFRSKPRKIAFFSGLAAILLLISAFLWYNINISPISTVASCKNYTAACTKVNFKVAQGDTANIIAENLQKHKIIRNKTAFSIYLRLSGQAASLKAGLHSLDSAMTASEIITALSKSTNQNVFNFTILPGENLFDIQKKLQQQGYGTMEIEQAFKKEYDHPILRSKPKEASLEGYMFGETYEFFADESVENIIKRTLDQTNKFVNEHHLEEKYSARGFNLHQGLTMASIIQKETKIDHATIAQIFEKRFKNNEQLGSDVTVSYAVQLVDPQRETYRTNAEKLQIDSPYNTRKHPGLPPTPIASPGKDSLLAVANPADTDFYYFLTGDDGKMYYGKTDAEHNYNIRQFCQRLCAVEL